MEVGGEREDSMGVGGGADLTSTLDRSAKRRVALCVRPVGCCRHENSLNKND